MLTHSPMVLGLTLCEDVVVDPATRNVSLLRTFTGLPVERFPTVARPFCAFATMTNGLGEAVSALSVTHMGEDVEEVYRVRRSIRFNDPLQIVYYVMRLAHCPLPRPGAYLFTLWLDDRWMAQRVLRVYPATSIP